MDLYALKCFVNLAESLHFGKAGELSNLSPSALSRSIKRIEEEVGKPLFIRDNRSVSLTRAGELFFLYAREAIQAYRTFQETLEAETEVMRGEVVVASSLSAGAGLLGTALAPFRRSYPRVNVTILIREEQKCLSLITEGEADVAALFSLPDYVPKGILIASLGETPLVFIAPAMACPARDLIDREERAWDEIPMVITEADLARRRLDSWFRGRDLKPKIAAQAANFEEVLTLVSLGCGLGVVPRILLDKHGGEAVRILDVVPKLVGFNYGFAALKRRLQHPVVRALWESATRESAGPIPSLR